MKKRPEGFGGWTSRKKLCMHECEALEDFPPGLSNLCALKELNFLLCQALRKVQEGLGRLTILKKLGMQGCEALKEFPPGLSNLCALEVLEFS